MPLKVFTLLLKIINQILNYPISQPLPSFPGALTENKGQPPTPSFILFAEISETVSSGKIQEKIQDLRFKIQDLISL
jgi:hypothetical protein